MYKTVQTRLFYFLLLFLIYFNHNNCNAQVFYPIHSDYTVSLEELIIKDPHLHVNIQPVASNYGSKINLIDSVFEKNDDLKSYQWSAFSLHVNPIIQSSYLVKNGLMQHQSLGLHVEGEIGNHFSFFVNYAANTISRKPFENTRLDSANLIPVWGPASRLSNTQYYFNLFTGRINFSINRYLNFQLGHDKNFFGDGYRSLFLSDNAPAYTFFSTTLNIWNIKYVNQVMLLNDFKIGKSYTSPTRKYAAMHMLSWNVFKKLNISLFEAVIWQSRDSSGNYRSLEIHYMNPLLVFRPVEYNLGSPDNMLIGVGSRLQILPKTFAYGQILLDEFYLKEILAGSDWWANKYAIQFGIKTYRFLSIDHLFLQTEINIARPFTYGHSYPLQNYGYLFQALAHPQGANFKEALFRCSYQKNRWILHGSSNFITYGLEQSGAKTIGSDIYQTSNNRIIRNSKDEGNFIGQGIPANELNTEFKIARVLNSRWGLIAEAGVLTNITMKPTYQNNVTFTFGIKTWLYRDEKLF